MNRSTVSAAADSYDDFTLTVPPLVDWLTVLLWTVEMAVRGAACGYAFAAILAVHGNRVFHANFRLLFCLILLRSPVHTVQRVGNIVLRTFVFGKERTTAYFTVAVSLLSALNTLFHVTALVLMSLERALSAYASPAWYDSHFQSCSAQLLLLLGTIVLNLLVDVVVFKFAISSPLFFVALPASVYILTGLMAMLVYAISLHRRRRRYARPLHVADRLRNLENIRATQLFIPCMASELVYSLFYFGLAYYSICCTPYAMGTDTSRLSHAYEYVRLGAAASSFQPIFVYFRHARFVRERQRFLEEFKRPEDKDKTTKEYFNELAAMWK